MNAIKNIASMIVAGREEEKVAVKRSRPKNIRLLDGTTYQTTMTSSGGWVRTSMKPHEAAHQNLANHGVARRMRKLFNQIRRQGGEL